MQTARVDTHTHLIPPFWAEELKSHGGDPSGWGAPTWSPERLFEFMDDQGIATSMLSLTAPGIEGWHGPERVAIAQRINDYGSELMRKQPGRLGYFASLALPDVDAGLLEIRRALDTLGADGIVLHSNFDGIYLGDPMLEPIWAELDDRAAVVFLHPTTPPGVKVLAKQPSPVEDYPADTTKCALDLVSSGVIAKFPSVRIILSHGGGFMPYAADRFAELTHSLFTDRAVEELITDMKSFYYDTALMGATGLGALLDFAAPGHVLFGTDYPYASENVSKTFTKILDGYSGYPEGELARINGNAKFLFPRL